jgi:hypothetical protein
MRRTVMSADENASQSMARCHGTCAAYFFATFVSKVWLFELIGGLEEIGAGALTESS